MKKSREWELRGISYISNLFKYLPTRVIDINTSQPPDNMQDWYNQDVDLLVVHTTLDNTFHIWSGEIKACDQIHKTGNVFLEVEIQHPQPYDTPQDAALYQTYHPLEPYSELGWFMYSKASSLLYIDTVARRMYKIPMAPLRDLVLSNPDRWPKRSCADNRRNETVYSYGYCVNIDYILNHIDGCITYHNI